MILPFDLFHAPVEIRIAAAGDAAAIAAIHAAAFAHPWPALTIESMLADRSVRATVAEQRGLVIGFIMVRAALDEAEILSIALAPGQRGKGIATRLVEAEFAGLATTGVTRLFLEVEAGNGPALKLYRRLGFVEIGRRKGYYRDSAGNRTDALTMCRDMSTAATYPRLLDA